MTDKPQPPKDRPRSKTFVPVKFQDENGDWRVKIEISNRVFDDQMKGIFLQEYARHGRMQDAARLAGVSVSAVNRAIKDDPIFGEACLTAEYSYRDRLIAHHQDLVFNGIPKNIYNSRGELVAEERIFPIKLIEMELKKHDPSYNDKRSVDVRASGGVLVAPADVATIEDWQKRFSDDNLIEIVPNVDEIKVP